MAHPIYLLLLLLSMRLCAAEQDCPAEATAQPTGGISMLQGQRQVFKDGATASNLARQEISDQDNGTAADLLSVEACPKDTGGTCNWWAGCSKTRGTTECSSGKCLCPSGKCAFQGKCVDQQSIAQCPKETGGTCGMLACKDWRSASCYKGQCVCRPGECAVEGRCADKPMAVPEKQPSKVAVVGCGIAGALTALELAHRGIQVEVIDREDDCGVGTSGRIAAELMFYSYRKSIWKGGWADLQGYAAMATNLQGGATLEGMGRVKAYRDNGKKLDGAGQYEVVLSSYKAGQLRFKRVDGPPLIDSSSLASVEGGRGHTLFEVSGLPPRDIYEMSRANDTDAQLQKYLEDAPKPLTLKIGKGEDIRTNPVYAGGFFEAAGTRLSEFFLVHYPELCEAVVTPFCCVKGTKARAWVAANPQKAGYTCPDDPFAPTNGSDSGLGVAHVIVSEDRLGNIQDRPKEERERFDFELWDADQTKAYLGDWVKKSELNGEPVEGSVVNRNDAGFVRTELVFKVIKQIMTKFGATYKFGQEVTGITPTEEGVSLSMRAAGGKWSEAHGILGFTPGTPGPSQAFSYDRAIFTTGAAIGSALDTFDPVLRNGPQLMPAHGYIILGRGMTMTPKHRTIGVVYERAHMYLRTTREGHPAIGGGMFFNGGTDDDCRELKWRGSLLMESFNANSYMRQAPIGEELIKQRETLKLGGVRPLSVFGNFPLLKSYHGGRVVLNTGGGANGFVTSWKAGQLAADLALSGKPAEPYWTRSFTAM